MNLSILEAAKLSIANDPDFTMATWEHCIASHVCRAQGYTVQSTVSGVTATDPFGQIHAVSQVAYELIPSVSLFYIGRWPMDVSGLSGDYPIIPESFLKDKEKAYKAIDHFIAVNTPKTVTPELEAVCST